VSRGAIELLFFLNMIWWFRY